MLGNTLGDIVFVQGGDIQVFVHGSDVNICGAWEAVVAVDAAALEVSLNAANHGSIVFFLLGKGQIANGIKDMLLVLAAYKGANNGGPGKRIVDALSGGHGSGKGAVFWGKKFSGAQGFHNRNTNIHAFTKAVKFGPVWV